MFYILFYQQICFKTINLSKMYLVPMSLTEDAHNGSTEVTETVRCKLIHDQGLSPTEIARESGCSR